MCATWEAVNDARRCAGWLRHQPLVFCLRRGLLQTGISLCLLGASPSGTTPHIQQAHPSTCPQVQAEVGISSSLNLPVSLHRLSTASDGGAGAGGRGGGRGGFHSCRASRLSRDQGRFQRGANQSHCPVFKAPSPSASATCLVQACSNRNEQGRGEVLHFSPPCVA